MYKFLLTSILLLSINCNYSQSLAVDWIKTFGGSKSEVFKELTSDRYGNVYITGSFKDSVDFDPSNKDSIIVSQGLTDCYIKAALNNGVSSIQPIQNSTLNFPLAPIHEEIGLSTVQFM